jgi:hypothetical protein
MLAAVGGAADERQVRLGARREAASTPVPMDRSFRIGYVGARRVLDSEQYRPVRAVLKQRAGLSG